MFAIYCGELAMLLSGSPAGAGPLTGQPAPAFAAVTLGGERFDLAKLRGKVVLVSFWASWCTPCREEMPVLDALYQRYHGEGLEMIAVSIDELLARQRVMRIMSAHHFPGATLDGVEVNGFGKPRSVPLTYVVGADGVLRGQFVQARNAFGQIVLPLLRKTPPASPLPRPLRDAAR